MSDELGRGPREQHMGETDEEFAKRKRDLEYQRQRAREEREEREREQIKAKEKEKALERIRQQGKKTLTQRQIEYDLYGETAKHKEIREEWKKLHMELDSLQKYGTLADKKREAKIKKQMENLRREYAFLPYEYPKFTFDRMYVYEHTPELRLVRDRNGLWKLDQHGEVFYRLVKDKLGNPIGLTTHKVNATIYNFLHGIAEGVKVAIPLRLRELKLESAKKKEEKKVEIAKEVITGPKLSASVPHMPMATCPYCSRQNYNVPIDQLFQCKACGKVFRVSREDLKKEAANSSEKTTEEKKGLLDRLRGK